MTNVVECARVNMVTHPARAMRSRCFAKPRAELAFVQSRVSQFASSHIRQLSCVVACESFYCLHLSAIRFSEEFYFRKLMDTSLRLLWWLLSSNRIWFGTFRDHWWLRKVLHLPSSTLVRSFASPIWLTFAAHFKRVYWWRDIVEN